MHDLRHLIADAGGTNPRLTLAAVKALSDDVDWLLVRAVRLAREEGYDWGRIGRLLGVSRQAARQRFERLAPLAGPTPPRTRDRTPWEVHATELAESSADLRRRREFESGNAVAVPCRRRVPGRAVPGRAVPVIAASAGSRRRERRQHRVYRFAQRQRSLHFAGAGAGSVVAEQE